MASNKITKVIYGSHSFINLPNQTIVLHSKDLRNEKNKVACKKGSNFLPAMSKRNRQIEKERLKVLRSNMQVEKCKSKETLICDSKNPVRIETTQSKLDKYHKLYDDFISSIPKHNS
jgi:uncharacterized protein YaaR (DUF327 family)